MSISVIHQKVKVSLLSCSVTLVLMALLPDLFLLVHLLLGMPAPPLLLSASQLNLIHSEVSNLAGFDVEGVINPTNAELELKDDLGELLNSLPSFLHPLSSAWA